MSPHRPTLAIVIPTLNEEESLRLRLPEALAVADEVVVSDGGSCDRSREVAVELGAQVVTGARGRGEQMNLGARRSSCDVFLFLHADTSLPPEAGELVRQAIERGAQGGAFYLRFESPRAVYRLGEKVVNLRSRALGVPLGDQAQFASRRAFEALGGFRDWPILEDLDFFRRLRRYGRVEILRQPVTTSARRFEELGPLRTVVRNWLILGLFALKVPPQHLARLYRHIR